MAKLEKSIFRPLGKSRRNLIIAAILMLIIAYFYGSNAIDTGSYLDYFLTIAALFLATKAAIWAFRTDGKE